MLDTNLRQQLQTYLERLTQPVQIVASLDHSDASREMQRLLRDIVGLSPLLTLGAGECGLKKYFHGAHGVR